MKSCKRNRRESLVFSLCGVLNDTLLLLRSLFYKGKWSLENIFRLYHVGCHGNQGHVDGVPHVWVLNFEGSRASVLVCCYSSFKIHSAYLSEFSSGSSNRWPFTYVTRTANDSEVDQPPHTRPRGPQGVTNRAEVKSSGLSTSQVWPGKRFWWEMSVHQPGCEQTLLVLSIQTKLHTLLPTGLIAP